MNAETRAQRIANGLSAAEDYRLAGQPSRALAHLQQARKLASGQQREGIQAKIDALTSISARRWR